MRVAVSGGSSLPLEIIKAVQERVGLTILEGYGLSETSPVATLSTLRPEVLAADEDTQADMRARAGMALPGVEMRITDEDGAELPWDDAAAGQVEVRGPWIASAYYRPDDPIEQFTDDGWLRTGDVGALDALGYMRLVDRTKDLIKSGGEWISSVELENAIMAHPDVAEAAVIAVPHPKWMERPLACVVAKPDTKLSRDDVLEHLRGTGVPKMGLPDDVVFVDEIPKTSVGKFSKRALREKFADYELPS